MLSLQLAHLIALLREQICERLQEVEHAKRRLHPTRRFR
jgi:hypothetical protein